MDNFKDKFLNQPVLLQAFDEKSNNHIRMALGELGFLKVIRVSTHLDAIAKIKLSSLKFKTILFDAYKTDLEPLDFIHKVKEIDDKTNLIVLSDKMHIEDMFHLLKQGAVGFLVPPFTLDAIERSIISAERVASIDSDILRENNISEAVVEAVFNNFEMLGRLMSLESGADNLKKVIIKERLELFRESVDVAKSVLSKDDYVESIMNRCIESASKGSNKLTRLGRLRKELAEQRLRKKELKDKEKEENL